MFRITTSLLLLVITSGAAIGQTLRSQISAREAWVGQPITLQIHILEAKKISEPQVPEVDGLDIEQLGEPSRISRSVMAYGRVTESNSAIYHYQVTPKQPGSFTIPPIQVELDGQTQSTLEHRFTAKVSETGDLMYAEITGPRKQVYVGQPVKLTLNIWLRPYYDSGLEIKLTDANMWQLVSNQSQWGSFTNAIRELAQTRHSPICKSVERVDDAGEKQEYYCYEIEATVYPQRPGPMNTGHVEIQVSYPTRLEVPRRRGGLFGDDPFPDDLFSRNRLAQNRLTVSETRPVQVSVATPKMEVIDVPTADRPADYRGAVGKYQIIARTQSIRVAAGDPIPLQMVVQGDGPMELIQAPPLSTIPGFTESFRIADDASAGFVQDDAKLFVTTLRPRHEGVTEIPAVPFSFFNPETEKFETVFSEPIPITVTPSESLSMDAIVGKSGRSREATSNEDGLTSEGGAEGGVLEPLRLYSASEILDERPTSWQGNGGLFLVGPILYFATLIWLQRSRILDRLSRLRSPVSRVKAAIRKADSPGKVAEILSQHLDSFPDSRIAEVLARCQQAAYSPGQREPLSDLKAAAYQAFSEGQPSRTPHPRTASPSTYRLLVLMAATITAGVPQMRPIVPTEMTERKLDLSTEQQRILLSEAHQLHSEAIQLESDPIASRKLLDAAIAKYQMLIESGLNRSKLCFNIGNAYWMSNQLGLAIASYEAVLLRDPYHRAAQQNLNRVRELMDEKPESPSISMQIRDWNRWVPAGWVWVAGVVSWTLLWLVATGKTVGHRSTERVADRLVQTKQSVWTPAAVTPEQSLRGSGFWSTLQFACLILALASLGSLLISNNQVLSIDTIVVADTAMLHEADGTTFPVLGALSVGDGATALDERGDWLRIKADSHRIGWVEKSKVYRLK